MKKASRDVREGCRERKILSDANGEDFIPPLSLGQKGERRSMENEIYGCTITPASKAPDGETPTRLSVSKESCGYAVWLQGFDIGTGLLALFNWDRNNAIEYAVARKHAGENELACQIKLLCQ